MFNEEASNVALPGRPTISEDYAPRFYKMTQAGLVYSCANADTALISANAIATSITATAKPIIGIFNPAASAVNLILLQAILGVSLVAASAVNPKGFYYMAAAPSQTGSLSTGTANGALNRNTFVTGAGAATIFTGGNTALTGMTGNLINLGPVGVPPVLNAAGAATAVSIANGEIVDNIDGSIVIPPGGFLGIMNNVSITTLDVLASLLWAELPITA